MSRFYSIVIGASPSGNQGATFTNMVNGKPDPGALMVELDLQEGVMATPSGDTSVKIWGVSLQQISQASDFNQAPITISAGMQPGLPLATAATSQAGIIITGLIRQAFGNWLGTSQSLDLIVQADGGATQAQPANIVFHQAAGTQMADAIQSTLSTAYPGYKLNINVSSNLVLPADEAGYYSTMEQFALYLSSLSQSILPDNYSGIDIVVGQNAIDVFDGSIQSNPIQIQFQDLIGQPTWLGTNQVQFSTVMRADIRNGSFIKFPPLSQSQTITTAQSFSQFRDKSTFQGTWLVTGLVRHVGNSRAPNAQSWISTFQCVSVGSPDAVTAANNSAA